MGLGSFVGKFFRSGPPTEEVVGEITDVRIDPQGDGKSVVYRIARCPEVEFRQRPNVLSSVHKQRGSGKGSLQPDRRLASRP